MNQKTYFTNISRVTRVQSGWRMHWSLILKMQHSREGTWPSDFTFTFHFHALAKEMATHLCSCLENPRDGGAWWAAVYGVAQSRTRLKQLSSSSSREGKWLTGFKNYEPLWVRFSVIWRQIFILCILTTQFLISLFPKVNDIMSVTGQAGCHSSIKVLNRKEGNEICCTDLLAGNLFILIGVI